jgi:BlaI family transcriptional regulator, penicillinase repressor
MPPKTPRKGDTPLPTAAEVDILAVLWRLGPATVREVHDELAKDSGYTTTQKQMQLMLDKRMLIRKERFGAHVYEAAIPKEQTQKQILGDLLGRVFEGSSYSLVMGALGAKPASAKELDKIGRMIEEAGNRRGKSK